MHARDLRIQLLRALAHTLQSWAELANQRLASAQRGEAAGGSTGKFVTPPTASPAGQVAAAPGLDRADPSHAPPPPHWLERVRSAGPPAHWLERVHGVIPIEGEVDGTPAAALPFATPVSPAEAAPEHSARSREQKNDVGPISRTRRQPIQNTNSQSRSVEHGRHGDFFRRNREQAAPPDPKKEQVVLREIVVRPTEGSLQRDGSRRHAKIYFQPLFRSLTEERGRPESPVAEEPPTEAGQVGVRSMRQPASPQNTVTIHPAPRFVPDRGWGRDSSPFCGRTHKDAETVTLTPPGKGNPSWEGLGQSEKSRSARKDRRSTGNDESGQFQKPASTASQRRVSQPLGDSGIALSGRPRLPQESRETRNYVEHRTWSAPQAGYGTLWPATPAIQPERPAPAQSSAVGELQPSLNNRWPALPEAKPLEASEDCLIAARARERLRRLDEEQRGT